MSSKSGRAPAKAGASENGSQLRAELDRLIEKERFKDALKQAKLCYKQEGTPENHQLLEWAYFLRARQLVQLGMSSSAAEVAGHLLEFGVTGGGWVDDFAGLLITLGLSSEAFQIQDRFGSSEKKELFRARAADEAVIHPERHQESSPEIARDAGLIRQALERLREKDEAGAIALLRDLARASVLSEWKFFVRGLAAYYRDDSNEIRANWDRLDPKRKAFPIAQRLIRLRTWDDVQSDSVNTESIEKAAFGEPVLARLRQMSGLVANQEWEKVFRILRPLRHTLSRIDLRLAERLTGAVIGSLIHDTEDLDLTEGETLVQEFIDAAQPLAFDPHWNRLWAIIWEGPQGDPFESLDYWAKYISDLETVPGFNSAERALARAMVSNHMAALHGEIASELGSDDGPFGLPMPTRKSNAGELAEIRQAKNNAINCLERSLKFAPDHPATYRLLVEAYRGWDESTNFEAAAERLLAKFPDDLETIADLARHYSTKNDPAAALPLVQKARSLKPLDQSLRDLEWAIRVSLARVQAIAKRWEDGREQFRVAEQLSPQCRKQFFYLARRAIFEAKAGQPEESDRFLELARAGLQQPTALWLALLIESIRYKLPKAAQKNYTQRWESALKTECQSEAAAEMASLMGAFVGSEVDYTGRAGHIKKVVAYLQRTTRLKYRCNDLELVCEFLAQLDDKAPLLENLVKLGIRQYPDSAILNYHAGLLEANQGVFGFKGAKGIEYLEKARKLAEASSEPREMALLPLVKSALTLFNEMGGGPLGFLPFGNGGPAIRFPDAFQELLDFFGDEFADDDEPGPSPFARPPSPARPKKKKSSKRR